MPAFEVIARLDVLKCFRRPKLTHLKSMLGQYSIGAHKIRALNHLGDYLHPLLLISDPINWRKTQIPRTLPAPVTTTFIHGVSASEANYSASTAEFRYRSMPGGADQRSQSCLPLFVEQLSCVMVSARIDVEAHEPPVRNYRVGTASFQRMPHCGETSNSCSAGPTFPH